MAVKKFVKIDSEKGYIDNKDDINYYISNLMRKVAFGKMLGDFDENGLYVISKKIVEELIKMPKVIVEILEDSDLIRSKVKADAFFHFILTVEDNKASFKLLEKIPYQSNRDFNSGAYNNINEYVLDEVIIPDKDFNRNALYEKYNISTDNDGEVLSIFDMDELSLALYYNIIEKLKVDYLVQNALILKEKELEGIEADYFESILGVFEEFKEFGDKVTASVKKDLAEKHNFVIISKPFFQKAVNEVLDSYIDFHIQEMPIEQREEILSRVRAIKDNYYQKFKEIVPIEIAQKAGVRFNNNKILQETIIGGIAKEIVTKGYTKSDIRKILINEDELQLSISKIKQMVGENEEICKRDNTKAKDITANRGLTAKFYEGLEKENKVDILKPDTTLIKSAIDENKSAKEEEVKSNTAKQEVAKASTGGAAKKPAAKSKGAGASKGKSAGASKPAAKKPAAKKPDAKKGASAQSGAPAKSKQDGKIVQNILYGSGIPTIKEEETNVLDDILDIEMMADNHRKPQDIEDENGLSLR